MKKVFSIDVLVCPECSGQMAVAARQAASELPGLRFEPIDAVVPGSSEDFRAVYRA